MKLPPLYTDLPINETCPICHRSWPLGGSMGCSHSMEEWIEFSPLHAFSGDVPIRSSRRQNRKRLYAPVRTSTPAIARVMEKLVRDGVTTCWLFGGCLHEDGYGEIGVSTTGKDKVHRVSYRHFKGQIPDGLMVLHRCDVPACWNPDHLFIGTQTDNMRDMQAKGRVPIELQRARMKHCRKYLKEDSQLRGAQTKRLKQDIGYEQ